MKEYSSVKALNQEIYRTITANPNLSITFSVKGELVACSYRGKDFYFKIFDKPEEGVVVDKSKLPTIACATRDYKRFGISDGFKDGQSVIVKGTVTVWSNKGEYRLIATSISLDGQGLREQQLAQLRAKLEKEGFFDPANKKTLPKFPKKVGIVTAATGKGFSDITSAAYEKNPYLSFVFQPVQVEGQGSAASVVRGIKVLDAMGLDIIIVGRGGGTPESLWTFDEEIVLRAIFEAKTPIISAVGHEEDCPLSDEVADVRAKTPTYAGTMVAVDINSIINNLDELKSNYFNLVSNKINTFKLMLNNAYIRLSAGSPWKRLENQRKQLEIYSNNLANGMNAKLNSYRSRLDRFEALIAGKSPEHILNEKKSRLNELDSTMKQNMDNKLIKMTNELSNFKLRLEASKPDKLLEKRKQEFDMLSKILYRNMTDKYQRKSDMLNILVAKLNGLSPTAKLVNGFGYISVEGEALVSAKNVSKGDKLSVTVSDGVVNTVVDNVEIKNIKNN